MIGANPWTRLRGWQKVALSVLVGGVLWGTGFWVYNYVEDRSDKSDEPCFDSTYRVPRTYSQDEPSVEIGGEPQSLEIAFGQSRGSARDEVHLEAPSGIPHVQLVNEDGETQGRRLEIHATSLDGERGTLERKYVHGRAKILGSALVIDVCVDGRTRNLASGTYEGSLIITDPRVAPLTLPVTMTVQARYVWALAPMVLLLPLLGLVLVWQSVTNSDHRANFGRGALVTYVTALGATAAVFGGQGLNNPAWGGAEAFFALIATMYVAATGATASLGGPGGGVAQDNPAKV